jgi:hypothetical protein
MFRVKCEPPNETFDDLMRLVTAARPHIKTQIRQDRQALSKNHTPTSSANVAPSKPRHDNSPVSKSPSKSALKPYASETHSVHEACASKSMKECLLKTRPWRQTSSEYGCSLTSRGGYGKPRPEEGPTTTRARSRSRASTPQQPLDQLPDDDESPMQTGTPLVVPVVALATTVSKTPRWNRTAPSTPKRTCQGHGQGVNRHPGATAKITRRTSLGFHLGTGLCSWIANNCMLWIPG